MSALSSDETIPWFCGTEYQCRECAAVFYSVDELLAHLRSATNGRLSNKSANHHSDPEYYILVHGSFQSKAVFTVCKVCDKNVKLNLASLTDHLSKTHNMTVDEYRQNFDIRQRTHVQSAHHRADMEILDEWQVNSETGPLCIGAILKLDKCVDCLEKIGGKSFEFDNFDPFKPHSPSGYDEDDDVIGTDQLEGTSTDFQSWSNQTSFWCHFCRLLVAKQEPFKRHLSSDHDLCFSMYYAMRGRDKVYGKKVYHQCKICQAKVLLTPASLKSHFRKECQESSKMDAEKYFKKYCRLNNSSRKSSSSDVINKRKHDVIEGTNGSKVIKIEGGSYDSDDKSSSESEEEKQKSRQKAKSDPKYNWANGRTMTCLVCGDYSETSFYVMNQHVRMYHRDTVPNLTAQGLITKTEADYRCLVCYTLVPHDYKNIANHLRKKHSMAMRTYCHRFDVKNGTTRKGSVNDY